MIHSDLSDFFDPSSAVSVKSIFFQRKFVIDSMHELFWNRINILRQTNNDSRLVDYEAVYEDLRIERERYERILLTVPIKVLLEAAY